MDRVFRIRGPLASRRRLPDGKRQQAENKVRLLHLVLGVILIFTSLWVPVFGEPGSAITQGISLNEPLRENADNMSVAGGSQVAGNPEAPQDPDNEPADNQDNDPGNAPDNAGIDANGSYGDPGVTNLPENPENASAEKTIGILSANSVTNLTATPDTDNRTITLNWVNPAYENFSYVIIQLMHDYGGDGVYWEPMGNTRDNPGATSFTISNLRHFTKYTYRVVVCYGDDSRDQSPPSVVSELILQHTVFDRWDMDYDGMINSDNIGNYRISACFIAGADITPTGYITNDITSIGYEISTDNINWSPIDVKIIKNDYGLDYRSWENYWCRDIYLDFTGLNYGKFWIRATASDTKNETVTAVKEMTKDLVCEDVTNFTAVPSGSAIALSWTPPADYSYGKLYREEYYYGWYWESLSSNVAGSSYTDTDIDAANPYKTYRYKLVAYDRHGNESKNPPVVSAHLTTDSPISFFKWSVPDEGRLNQYASSSCNINAYFHSVNTISSIDYNYSLDGVAWLGLEPFISNDNGLEYVRQEAYGYRSITLNLGAESGIPDGEFHIQAVCRDESGNSYTEETTLLKDATRPQNVSNVTAVPSEDKTSIILSWTNPVSDFKFVTLERDGSYISPAGYNQETFTDKNIKTGQRYTYTFKTYDNFGNMSETPVSVQAVIPVGAPVLEEMYPEDNFATNSNTMGYSATFRSDKTIDRIVIEASKDGTTWITLKDGVPSLDYSGYELQGTWDISNIIEEEWILRATAYDEEGVTATGTRKVLIDHKAPPAPTNFKADITSLSPYRITLTWDSMEGVSRYYLTKNCANPDNYGSGSEYINSPAHSYLWTYGLYNETPYIFKIRSIDKAGNWSGEALVTVEIHSGPEITLDRGYDVYTNSLSYVINGSATPGASVTVNGSTAATDANGRFSYSTELALLNEQSTTFKIIASKDGINHTVNQKVTFDNETPDISTFNPGDGSVMGGIRARINVYTYDNLYSGIQRQVLQVSKDDGASWLDILEIPASQSEIYWDTTVNIGGSPLADGPYKFRLIIWDKAGNSSNIVRNWQIDNTKPEPPTALTAVADTGKIKLSWHGSISSDLRPYAKYSIYRSLTSGSGYYLYDTTNNTSYDDSRAIEGVTYYYKVTANDATGNESNYSNEVSASLIPDTIVPEFYTLPSENSDYGGPEIRVYFSAIEESPKGVDRFILEYSNDGGVTWKPFTSEASHSNYGGESYYYTEFYINTSTMVSGNYIFRFSAVDHSGNTAVATRNVKIDLTVEKVQNLKARPQEGAIVLDWTVSPDTDISTCDILRSAYYSGGYDKLTTVNGKYTFTYKDIYVTIGKTYYYKIISRDAYSNQAVSAIVTGVATDDSTPPQITAVNVADMATIGGKKVSLTVSATDNKKPVGVSFEGSQDSGTTWKPVSSGCKSITPGPDGVSYDFECELDTAGLKSGEIIVRITARDAAGNESSVEKTWNLDVSVTPPSNVRTTSGDGSILIEWDPVTDADIYDFAYDIMRSTTPGGPYITLCQYLTDETVKYTDTNVETGKTYYYVILVRDKLGNDALSTEAEASPAKDNIPPFIVAITPEGGSTAGGAGFEELVVCVSDNAGKLGLKAKIEYSADGGEWLPAGDNITGPENSGDNKYNFKCSLDLRELSTGVYQVRYTITDAAGNSTSQTVNYLVDRTAPSAPSNLMANYGQNAVGLAWEISPEADTIGYNIYRANDIAGEYTRLNTSKAITVSGRESNIYSDNTVLAGLTYFYRAAAIDKFNQEGPMSNIASAAAVNDSTPPVVTLIEPEHHTKLGAVATITVTAEDNTALSCITLQYNTGAEWADIDTQAVAIGNDAAHGTAVFEWHTKPLYGNVKVRAIAKDSAGNLSDQSDSCLYRAYVIDNVGPSVTELRGTAFGGDIVLEWDSVPDRDLDYFLVEQKNDKGVYKKVKEVYNILGVNISGLEPATDYWFRVTAIDKLGNPGEPAEIMVNSGADNTPPTVEYIFAEHIIYTGNTSILITPFSASDNVRVKKLTIQYSSDETNWKLLKEIILDPPARFYQVNENWDVSSLPDGDYYVRIIAEDEAGNVSQPSETGLYVVDHIKPAAPYNLVINPSAGFLDIKWSYNAEKDFSCFKLWRAEAADGDYQVVSPGKYIYMGYRDHNVESGKKYYYKVNTIDAAENESGFSETVSGSLIPDTKAPNIYFSDPLEGEVLNYKQWFRITFYDDLALGNMRVEYQPENSGDGTWGMIYSKDYDGPDGKIIKNYAEEEFYWLNSGIPEGWYNVRVTVEDSAGNKTDPLIMKYQINNVPPEKPAVTGTAGGWQAGLSWGDHKPSADFKNYKIYKTDVFGGDPKQSFTTKDKSFTDTGVIPGKPYYYYVRAYDIYGNYSQSDTVTVIPTNEDKIAPVANAGDDLVLTVDMEAWFDGALSKDNDRIASYLWDFGDGSTAVTSQPAHSYSSPGNYTATLTVRDPAGNSSTDTVSVEVVSIDEVGILEVKVINDITGELLPGSSVVTDYPDGASRKITTNSVGSAFVVAPPGDYEVYVFKTDFKPASMKVTMIKGQKKTVMFRLSRGSVVTGELKAERMDFDEIIAAGIDVSDPANQNAFKYEINLGFYTPIPFIVTKNRFIRPPNAPQGFYEISEDGNKIIIRQKEKEEEGEGGDDSEGDENILYCQRLFPDQDIPAVAYLVIPGKAAWLREFFNVGLTVQNAADPEFTIEDALARLILPDGLSLAPTREGQHDYISMGTIAGGQSKSVNWIIRGDKRGEYTLEAEFTGLLMPFEDEIRNTFRNDEPFKVWAEDALLMHIITQDRADKGYPYNLRIGLENVSDVPLYNVSVELTDDAKQSCIYAPNQQLFKTVEELKPGEIMWKDYQLVSAIDGVLSLDYSGLLKTGGSSYVEQEASSISVPENSKDNAPVLDQTNNANGTVSLSWPKIEETPDCKILGYKIYKIRDDLYISKDPPELVYSCGPDGPEGSGNSAVFSVTLPEPDGPKDYIINTITDKGEVMKHGITGLSWIDKAAKPVMTVDPEIVVVGRETEILVTVKKGGNPPENGYIDIGDTIKNKYLNVYGQVRVIIKPETEGPIEVRLYVDNQLAVTKTIQAVMPGEPKPPFGLVAEKGSRKAILSWIPNIEPELDGYYVYQIIDNRWRKINPGMLKQSNIPGIMSYVVEGLKDNNTYTFQVTAVDIFGRESEPSDPSRITMGMPDDTAAPWVIGTSPASQAGNVTSGTAIQVFFSENIAIYSDTYYQDIKVKAGEQYITFEAEAKPGTNVLVITPNEKLPLRTHCEVMIPAGTIRDRSFNLLRNSFSFEFFTEAEADDRSPELACVTPRDNAQGVSVYSTIFLYFSEDIKTGTGFGNIRLTANGKPVAFTRKIAGAKVIIEPLKALPYSEKIEVFVPEAAVTDNAGNPSASQYKLTFYTDTLPDRIAPKVTGMNPSTNSSEVALNDRIIIYFSERIKEGRTFGRISLKLGDQVVSTEITIENNTLIIKPSINLGANKLYQLAIPAGAVTDLQDNQLQEGFEASVVTEEV